MYNDPHVNTDHLNTCIHNEENQMARIIHYNKICNFTRILKKFDSKLTITVGTNLKWHSFD